MTNIYAFPTLNPSPQCEGKPSAPLAEEGDLWPTLIEAVDGVPTQQIVIVVPAKPDASGLIFGVLIVVAGLLGFLIGLH